MKDFEIIRSRRKTLAIQIYGQQIIVRAPLRTPMSTIEKFVAEHEAWIEKKLRKHAESMAMLEDIEPLSPAELETLRKKAKEYIPQRVAYYAPIVGVSYERIAIRCQRSKWGSCSSKGNLNFNCLLMLTPPEVIDSVVVHELCHRKEMNHSPRFYALVKSVYPNYDAAHKWLKNNGTAIMQRAAANRSIE